MDSKKITKGLLLIIKLAFVVGSWLMNLFNKNGNIEYSTNLSWRNINEYSLYILIVLIIIELFLKDKMQILISLICIISALLLSQNLTAEGTRLDSWF